MCFKALEILLTFAIPLLHTEIYFNTEAAATHIQYKRLAELLIFGGCQTALLVDVRNTITHLI